VSTRGRRHPAAPNVLGATALLLAFLAWPLAWAPLVWLGPAAVPGQPAGAVAQWAVADSHRSVIPLSHGLAQSAGARHALAPAASVTPGAPATVQLSRLAPVPVLRACPPRAHRVPAPPVRAPPAS
jgi:hypothetical protein